MEAIVIDDEKKARETLRGLLSIIDPNVTVTHEAGTVEQSVEILKNSSADVVFLDIELLDGTGFDIVRLVGPMNSKIVFTTAYDHFALKAFRHHAIDYLLKPINMDELREVLGKVKRFSGGIVEIVRAEEKGKAQLDQLMEEFKNRMTSKKISINGSNKLTLIEIDNIVYCKSESSYSYVHLSNGEKIMSSSTLKSLEEELIDEHFFRVNNSYLVNLNKVKTLNKGVNHGELNLDNGETIEVSRRKKADLVRLLRKI